LKFWDSSALITLCVHEPKSAAMREVLRSDETVAAWWSTRIECLSGLIRLWRERTITGEALTEARTVLETLASSWIEVMPSESVRASAERLLAVHPLRSADALQLAAAIAWCGGRTRGAEMISLDVRLREAAVREGFTLLPART
jgi:hypothetical protein